MPGFAFNPRQFTEQMARRLRRQFASRDVRITGPLALMIDDKPLDLTDLHREIRAKSDEPAALMQKFIDSLVAREQLDQMPLPYDLVAERIFPRITPDDHLEDRPDLIALQPFINDTSIVYMIDLNGAAAPVRAEQMIRWGVGVEELDRLARRNLAATQPKLEIELYQTDHRPAALLSTGDGYDAARLLLDGLHPHLAPQLGRDFLVAIPTRDVFIAFPTTPHALIDRLRRQVAVDYQKLPYPITDRLFLVTRDGVADWNEAA
jgi:hypothetical protein